MAELTKCSLQIIYMHEWCASMQQEIVQVVVKFLVSKCKIKKSDLDFWMYVLSFECDLLCCCCHSFDSILSGSYDNTTRLWSTKGAALVTIPGHSAPVKCVGWIRHGMCSPFYGHCVVKSSTSP